QLLMLSGFERYYQIVKCFRDEDLRRDRQPEFTQVDIEKSFTDVEDMIDLNERLLQYVFKEVKGINVEIPFARMTYDDAMRKYGGIVKAIVVKDNADKYSRKDIEALEEYVKLYGAKGLAWLKYNDGAFTGPIAKFFSEDKQNELKEILGANENDLVFFGADKT